MIAILIESLIQKRRILKLQLKFSYVYVFFLYQCWKTVQES